MSIPQIGNKVTPPVEAQGNQPVELPVAPTLSKKQSQVQTREQGPEKRRKQWNKDWKQAQEDKQKIGYGDLSDEGFLSAEIGEGRQQEQSIVLDLQSRIKNLIQERSEIWPKPKYELFSLEQLVKQPPRQWLVDQLFGVGDIGMVYGQPGCGKTFVVIDMIMSMCLGTKCCEYYDVPRPLRVLYFAGEGGGGLQLRFQAAAKHHGDEQVKGLLICKTVPQLLDGKCADNLIREVQDRAREGIPPPDVIVIDTLHSAADGADENSSRDMGIVLSNVKKLVAEFECAAILVHHTNKGGTAERGSSALRGDTSFLLEVGSPPIPGQKSDGIVSLGRLSASKIKDAKDHYSLNFNLVESSAIDSLYVNWFEVKEGHLSGSEKERRDAIIQHMGVNQGKRFSREDIAGLLSIEPKHATNLLTQLYDKNECKKETKNNGEWSSHNPWVYFV